MYLYFLSTKMILFQASDFTNLSLQDGYVIDVILRKNSRFYLFENEHVSLYPNKHIGSQIIDFDIYLIL